MVFEDVLRFEGILSWKFILMGKNREIMQCQDLWTYDHLNQGACHVVSFLVFQWHVVIPWYWVQSITQQSLTLKAIRESPNIVMFDIKIMCQPS